MFKRCGAGQRIFPSEPAAPSMAPAPAPMTTSDSIPADLGYSISRPAVPRQVRLSVSSAIRHGSRRWIKLKAWVQEYGQPGGSSGLGNPGKLDVILAQPKNWTK